MVKFDKWSNLTSPSQGAGGRHDFPLPCPYPLSLSPRPSPSSPVPLPIPLSLSPIPLPGPSPLGMPAAPASSIEAQRAGPDGRAQVRTRGRTAGRLGVVGSTPSRSRRWVRRSGRADGPPPAAAVAPGGGSGGLLTAAKAPR